MATQDPNAGPFPQQPRGSSTRAEQGRGEALHDRYGGLKPGAVFFGWLIAVALTVLLTGIAGAIGAALGASLDVTPSQAQQSAGAIGLATSIALLLLLAISYFGGGYVAGRLARFDGGRQGIGVWLLGVLVTLAVAALGALFGAQYNIFARVDLPSIPIPGGTLTIGGAIALLVLLAVTLGAAFLGGKAGHRFHSKIDRTPTG